MPVHNALYLEVSMPDNSKIVKFVVYDRFMARAIVTSHTTSDMYSIYPRADKTGACGLLGDQLAAFMESGYQVTVEPIAVTTGLDDSVVIETFVGKKIPLTLRKNVTSLADANRETTDVF